MEERPDVEHFEHSHEEPPTRRPQRLSRPVVIVLVAALLAAAALVGYRLGWWGGRSGPDSVAEMTTAEPPPAAPAEEREPVELPALDASDAMVRELVSRLSASPRLASWLASDELLRRFAVAVANIAEGVSPSQHVPFMRPQGDYEGVGAGGAVIAAPASFRRYDAVAEVFGAIDTQGAASLYRDLEPLIEEAYRDLGYPAGGFDDALRRAIGELLATPVPPGDLELVPKVAGYEYADVELEALSPAQKQLLRTGPRNVERIQAKLRELARALGWADLG